MRAIDSGESTAISEGFLTLGEIVAVNRIHNFHSDFVPEANVEVLEWASLQEIQRSVQQWIESNPNNLSVVSAFWVLDKFHDRDLRAFLQKWLDHYVREIEPPLAAIGQILVDLNDLGESATSSSSFSATDYGKNLDDAVAYLKKHFRET